MSSSGSDQPPYNQFYDEPWSPPVPTGESWESRPTDLSSGADQEAYFRGSSVALSYPDNEDYYRGSTVEYPSQNEYLPRDEYPSQDEHLLRDRYPSRNDLSSGNGFVSEPMVYSNPSYVPRDVEDNQNDSYRATLDLDFSRLRLEEVDQDYGSGQADALRAGPWAGEEEILAGAGTSSNAIIPSMYGMYQNQEQPSLLPGDNYILSNSDEPARNMPGSSKRKHTTSHTSKTPKESKGHGHKATPASFPRDEWDTWIYLSAPAQSSSSASAIPAKARYDNSNTFGPIIKSKLAYKMGFDESTPLENRARRSYETPGPEKFAYTVGTISLGMQFDNHTSSPGLILDFHMMDRTYMDYDVLLPVQMIPGNSGSYYDDSVPAVAATQHAKYAMDKETEEEMLERKRRQEEEAERKERERQARREAARAAKKQKR